jgi:hypothetical protein
MAIEFLSLVIISINTFVPSKEISAPAGTRLVTLVISVAGCLLKTGESSGNETHPIDILYNDTPVAAGAGVSCGVHLSQAFWLLLPGLSIKGLNIIHGWR